MAVAGFADITKPQVLALDITLADNDGAETEIDDFKINIKVVKA